MGSNYQSELFKYCDEDQLPACFGGTCRHDFKDDFGPWNDYDMVEGDTPDQIGIRRKDDPHGKLFTPSDMLKLENPLVTGKGTWNTFGAVLRQPGAPTSASKSSHPHSGFSSYAPNPNATKSTPIYEELQVDAD